MRYIFTYLSGSRLYDLDRAGSDYDIRGVFALDKREEFVRCLDVPMKTQPRKFGSLDENLFEFTFYLRKLSCDVNLTESLFLSPGMFHYSALDYEIYQLLSSGANKLIDSRILYKNLTNAIKSNFEKAMAAEDYSDKKVVKNIVFAVRMSVCGSYFFTNGYWEHNIRSIDSEAYRVLKDLLSGQDILTRSYCASLYDLYYRMIQEAPKLRGFRKDPEYTNMLIDKVYHNVF
jgi:predicted nucleotidyltransferase